MEDAKVAVIIVATVAGAELIRWLMRNFLNKTVGTQYITEAKCRSCSTREDNFKKEIRENMALIKGVLVVMVLGKSVSQDQVDRLLNIPTENK